ncbi:sensor histidine kinase [Actinosynnema mirum]|uniref:histidine kinase n=1 Tax=Actinosynnema mirum (strain ATCC 29888 / DSM 43827 / JCM 3225 / NBRC 14064 / NCIMB 13271 / NRRL B-12336 / IMRU 3971 / 101) TaxID=446462 RepID=C6WIM6_ACTMD|nr:histidine kinase [Actinosynnema mirum]ACU38116.1 histidine kinase [Actinosynnema mirum DSM 43827]
MDDHPRGAWPPGRLDRLLTRIGVTGPLARDCLLAVVVAALSAGMLLVLFEVDLPSSPTVFSATRKLAISALILAQALLLCLRRVAPVPLMAVMAVIQAAITIATPDAASVRGFAPFVAAITLGSLLPVRRAVAVAAAASGLELVITVGALALGRVSSMSSMVMGFALEPDVPSSPFAALLGHTAASLLAFVGGVFVGNYFATQRRYAALLRLRADEAEREQRARIASAIGEERARMARELHDVAAHHLSGMVVQASAVERLIDRDPAAAKEGVVWLRGQGRETLDNLRAVVGVLRGGADGEDAPVPGLEVLDGLVRTAADLGARVELVREGQERPVPPIADIALYRVVQESLSNARQHAPGAPVRISLRYLPRKVELEVVNDRPRRPGGGPGSGVGLIGMRERAQLIGAAFTAAPTAAGGWCVMVSLPT